MPSPDANPGQKGLFFESPSAEVTGPLLRLLPSRLRIAEQSLKLRDGRLRRRRFRWLRDRGPFSQLLRSPHRTGLRPFARIAVCASLRAPLWGVRLRPRLMHDGESLTLYDAILRHGGEAEHSTRGFRRLAARDQETVLEFLRSL